MQRTGLGRQTAAGRSRAQRVRSTPPTQTTPQVNNVAFRPAWSPGCTMLHFAYAPPQLVTRTPHPATSSSHQPATQYSTTLCCHDATSPPKKAATRCSPCAPHPQPHPSSTIPAAAPAAATPRTPAFLAQRSRPRQPPSPPPTYYFPRSSVPIAVNLSPALLRPHLVLRQHLLCRQRRLVARVAGVQGVQRQRHHQH